MDPVLNPYVPGAGRKPAALVGRDRTLEAWDIALRRAERNVTDPPVVMYGLRGVGKTVLLTQFRHDAERRGWWAVQVEANPEKSLREMIGEGLYEPLSDANRPSIGEKLLKALKTAASFKASYDPAGVWTFGLDLSAIPGGGADSGVLETDLKKTIKDVALAAREEGVGLAILVDEAQDLKAEEMTTLAVVAQAAAQDNWPVLFAFAGLPNLPQILSAAKSYSERFRYEPVERLSRQEAEKAVVLPARLEGAGWEQKALDVVVDASGQYPYFIQQFGLEAWNVAKSTLISERDAEIGVATGLHQLDMGFFRSRWDRTTESEKQYLRAMCPEGETGVASSVIAERMGRAITSVGPTRAQLISKGIVYAPDHGIVAFTVPGMVSFIQRQPRPDLM